MLAITRPARAQTERCEKEKWGSVLGAGEGEGEGAEGPWEVIILGSGGWRAASSWLLDWGIVLLGCGKLTVRKVELEQLDKNSIFFGIRRRGGLRSIVLVRVHALP